MDGFIASAENEEKPEQQQQSKHESIIHWTI